MGALYACRTISVSKKESLQECIFATRVCDERVRNSLDTLANVRHLITSRVDFGSGTIADFFALLIGHFKYAVVTCVLPSD